MINQRLFCGCIPKHNIIFKTLFKQIYCEDVIKKSNYKRHYHIIILIAINYYTKTSFVETVNNKFA